MMILRLKHVKNIIVCYCLLNTICCYDTHVHVHESDIRKSDTACDFYKNVSSEEDKVAEQCSFKIKQTDLDKFERQLKQLDFQVSLLKLELKFSDEIVVHQTQCTITALSWVWTFKGENGGEPFLHMLKGWSYYSFGLLDYHSKTMPINIHKVGNCSVTIGERNTTERLGLTFINSINEIYRNAYNVDIETAYICYLSSIIDNADNWKSPFFIDNRQLLGYRCCKSLFNEITKNDTVLCGSDIFLTLNDLWWDFPYYISIFISLYSPLFILHILGKSEKCYNIGSSSGKWIASNPFTCSKMCNKILRKTFGCNRIYSCILKVSCVLSSFSVLVVAIVCFYKIPDLHSLLVDGIKAGVFFSWKSIAAGYSLSKDNYLAWFGGPYVALVLYIVTFSLMLCLPADLGSFLGKGFQDGEGLSKTLLTVDMATKARLGGLLNFHRKTGFTKLYESLKGNFYILINPSFWKFGINLQKRRLTSYLHLQSQVFLFKILVLITILPIYICVCVIEWVLVVIFNGVPIIGVCVLLIKAFLSSLVGRLSSNTRSSKIAKLIYVFIISLCLLFDFMILCTIFVESFVFLCDVAVNTYSGLIAYPEITFSYVVFVLTVMMYLTESIQHVSKSYNALFDKLVKISKTISLEQRCGIDLVKYDTNDQCLYVAEQLFGYVVRYYKPLRVQLLFSLIKVVLIAIVLYISISNLLVFNKMNKMGSLTQVMTSLFICLIPKLLGKFTKRVDKSCHIEERRRIREVVVSFCITSLGNDRMLHSVCRIGEDDYDNSEGPEPHPERFQSSSETLDELLLDIDM